MSRRRRFKSSQPSKLPGCCRRRSCWQATSSQSLQYRWGCQRRARRI